MKWRTGRFRTALKILFELRRDLKDVHGDAKILLYRVDAETDAFAIIGTFAGDLIGDRSEFSLGMQASTAREFAIAIESFTPEGSFLTGAGVRVWVGDQALARSMRLPIDGKPNGLEFTDPDKALDMIRALLEAEAAFVNLRGLNDDKE